MRKVDFNAGGYGDQPEEVTGVDQANLATSEVAGSLTTHKPLLDIDFAAKLIPSTTEGHFHLFLDKEVQWQDYELLLKAFEVCGLIEPGYVAASIDRGYTAVRLPWIKKERRSEAQAHDLQGP